MKTFELKQVKGHARKVLNIADRDGAVQIRGQNGRVYLVKPEIRDARKLASLRSKAG